MIDSNCIHPISHIKMAAAKKYEAEAVAVNLTVICQQRAIDFHGIRIFLNAMAEHGYITAAENGAVIFHDSKPSLGPNGWFEHGYSEYLLTLSTLSMPKGWWKTSLVEVVLP